MSRLDGPKTTRPTRPVSGRRSLAIAAALALAFVLTAIGATSAAARLGGAPAFQAGMNLLVYDRDRGTEDEFHWKIDTILDRLVADHINAVNIVWLVYTDGVRSSRVFKGKETPPDAAIDYIARQAVGRGLYVVLRPILDEESILADGRNEWRGSIRPSDRKAWFASYGSLITDYARLGEAAGVDAVNIGTELSSMESNVREWSALIDQVRQVFHGQLTYSSNKGISRSMPWAKLDYIGVDAFFRLDAPSATVPALTAAWTPWLGIIREAQALKKPLVLTEIGSASQAGAHRTSWVWDHRTPPDVEDQRLFYASACAAWRDQTQGMYWWATPIWILEKPLVDGTFTPVAKPAEGEIARCFASVAGVAPPRALTR